MVIKNKARNKTDPAKMIRSRPELFSPFIDGFVVFCFFFRFLIKSASGSKVVVSYLKKENYLKKTKTH